MKIEIIDKKIDQIKADCEVVFVIKGNLKHKWVKDKKDLDFFKFKGESEQVAFLPHLKKLYLGIESLGHDDLRSACAQAIKAVRATKCSILKIGTYSDKEEDGLKAMVEGFVLGNYRFLKYKSKKDNSENVKKIIISSEDYSDRRNKLPELKKALENGIKIAEAVNYTRELINHTPDDMPPSKVGELAKDLAKELKTKINIYDEKFLLKHGMHAFYAVSRGSMHKPRLIHLAYKPKSKAKAKIAFVGKGLTYDSGGLSLKPSDSMVTMKSDKSGAGAVLGIMKAAANLNLPVEIHGIIGATENMIGSTAYKPDDVLITKNGKTIEVRNTDAEGRLVLADCLSYAQEFKPDYLIDLATLTGACIIALGEFTIGVMGYDKELKRRILQAGENAGELAAELPFNKHLAKLIKSQVADIKNVTGSRFGGAITAGLFLGEFIGEKYKNKWVHLDIAGPAYQEKEWGYNPHGASGAGVRLCIKFLEQFK